MPRNPLYSPLLRTSAGFVLLALLCLALADLEVTTRDSWDNIAAILAGFARPHWLGTELLHAALATVAFAVLSVSAASAIGVALSVIYAKTAVRLVCTGLRGIHEIFWALLFMQVFGLSTVTGLLAIIVPYSCIIAKVCSERIEEANLRQEDSLPPGVDRISAFLYLQLASIWPDLKHYLSYRFECGLRSSAVLGFIGLPTLGFYLESEFLEGRYDAAAAILLLLYGLILTMRYWLRPRLLPWFCVASLVILPWQNYFAMDNFLRFLGEDIVPLSLRSGDLPATLNWGQQVFADQIVPGVLSTIQITVVTLVGSGIFALLLFPLVSRLFYNPLVRTAGNILLVVLRSTPEFILAFVFVVLWGPSMLPAIVALILHNGSIVAHITGRYTESVPLRLDSSRGTNRYLYEVLPWVYRPSLSLLFYRWEVMVRETAVLGLLGVYTLGFYVDSSFADMRFDLAMLLLVAMSLLTIAIDVVSGRVRASLRLTNTLSTTDYPL